MSSIGLLPALAMLAGALCGLHVSGSWVLPAWATGLCALIGWGAWWSRHARVTTAALVAGFGCAAAALCADARAEALHPSLRTVLEREIGGFAIDTPGPVVRHDPVTVRAVLLGDAARADEVTTLRASVVALEWRGTWRTTDGGVVLTVGGALSHEQADEWLAGRTIETTVTFRRSARYVNDGVPDFERDLALGGTTLFGSIKSALLVRVVAHGSMLQERAARLRLQVRARVARWVAPRDALSAAIVTAVLIGDRSGLPEPVRERLQAAGTYHVIAISGGNIAILAALVLGVLQACGVRGRPAALVTVVCLLAYAQIVSAGPSVWRATAMAVTYLSARLLDHRSPPWHALAVAATLILCARPLNVRDVGFVLTFGATAALLEGAKSVARIGPRPRVVAWLLTSLAASAAVEIALLPVSAWTFSRITSAGLLLNLLAVPAMGVVQIGGLVLVCLDRFQMIADSAGWAAHTAARVLVESALLVDVWPWLAVRVPPPPVWLMALYYAGVTGVLVCRGRARVVAMITIAASTGAIASGMPVDRSRMAPPGTLRITALDVGQGDATLIAFPDGTTWLVDAGGMPFGGGSFDIGRRVLAPALWARGVRRLDRLLITHGDPDHLGGADAVLEDFAPREVWEGIPVSGHAPMQVVRDTARRVGAYVEPRHAGDEIRVGDVRVRVLHPAPPDWERRRVRNDDSIVVELVYGDVAVLLTGDVGAGVERTILSQLTPTRQRILKAGHHGSRTSTSQELLDAWRPQVALISAGRGNTFGHPAPDVVERLEAAGSAIYRTDRDGQVDIETDGNDVHVRTYVGGTP